MVDVFIIGSKGVPSQYGGFETFVDKLTKNKKSKKIHYHVSCLGDNDEEFYYNDARCFNVKVMNIGSAKAIIYDIKALIKCVKYIKQNKLQNCIIYILACRIGPFLNFYKSKLNKKGIKIYVNPDGHEWKRSKWNFVVKKYWKLSEKLMVKNSDLLICDSKGIESYIKKDYKKYNVLTTFIAYGAELDKSTIDEDDVYKWYKKYNIVKNQYYLIVGRFVPENNYEVMIREFIRSNNKKDLVIITNVEENIFYKKLIKGTNFQKDARIKFVGTVYNKELLKKIRENAFAYIHGHEVGGTNPSLLEALASTKINLLLEVNFNKEVGEEGGLYFNKDEGNLCKLINEVDKFSESKIQKIKNKARKRIIDNYSWMKIVDEYERLFLNEFKSSMKILKNKLNIG